MKKLLLISAVMLIVAICMKAEDRPGSCENKACPGEGMLTSKGCICPEVNTMAGSCENAACPGGKGMFVSGGKCICSPEQANVKKREFWVLTAN